MLTTKLNETVTQAYAFVESNGKLKHIPLIVKYTHDEYKIFDNFSETLSYKKTTFLYVKLSEKLTTKELNLVDNNEAYCDEIYLF